MPIEWRDRLAVGNEMIDNDHRALIGIINDYEHAIDTKSGRELIEIFDHLSQYCKDHFEREEKLQQAIHFPRARFHKDCHQSLIQRLEEIHRSFIQKDYHSLEDLKALLRDWLISHIIEEDLKMIPYLKGGRR